MDDILILLLKKGAHLKSVKMTTTDIGTATGMSQQNASRRLGELEAEGYVEKKADGIILTQKAVDRLSALHATLRSAFHGERIAINGTIVKGLGDGKFYLSLDGYRKQIKQKLGFVPFPGTLNLKVDKKDMQKRQQLRRMEPVFISGFRDKERTYGDLFAYRCGLEGLECAVIIPLRTHHGPDVMEIISASDIKKALRKQDGDRVRLVV